MDWGKGDYYDYLDEHKLTPDQFNETLKNEGYDGFNLKGRNQTVIWNTDKIINTKNTSNTDMVLPFGKAKAYSQKFYDLAQSNQDNPGAQRLFNQMYQVAKGAKNSIPEIANASNEFHDLATAKELIENNFPSLAKDGKGFMAEKKLMRLYKDIGNIGFKENLNKAADILAKYPESKPLADFSQKIKELNVGIDMQKGKAVTPFDNQGGVQSIPILKNVINALKMKPSNKLSLEAKGIKGGWINPEAIQGAIPENETPFLGPMINNLRAYGKVLNTPKIPLPPSGTAPMMSIMNLIGRSQTDSMLNDTIRNIISK